MLAETISAMKLEVMPIMAIMDAACAYRERMKVAPRAPWLPNMMFKDWKCTEFASNGFGIELDFKKHSRRGLVL